MKNAIGIEQKGAKKLIKKLGHLLADYSVFYQNTRGYHWNIQGEKFFELHVKFEELYDDLNVKIDEIAERILTLGGKPNHAYSSYLKEADIKETKQTKNGKKAIHEILAALKTLIIHQRELLDISDSAGDEGTNALMSDYIREQEKLVWMYSAYVSE